MCYALSVVQSNVLVVIHPRRIGLLVDVHFLFMVTLSIICTCGETMTFQPLFFRITNIRYPLDRTLLGSGVSLDVHAEQAQNT